MLASSCSAVLARLARLVLSACVGESEVQSFDTCSKEEVAPATKHLKARCEHEPCVKTDESAIRPVLGQVSRGQRLRFPNARRTIRRSACNLRARRRRGRRPDPAPEGRCLRAKQIYDNPKHSLRPEVYLSHHSPPMRRTQRPLRNTLSWLSWNAPPKSLCYCVLVDLGVLLGFRSLGLGLIACRA